MSWDLGLPIWSGSGSIVWKATAPNDTSLIGAEFFNQVWVQDPKSNTLGVAVSNAGKGIVGK